MPYKTGKMKGELTTPEIRKLIKAHNVLVSIKIPKGSKREDIIKLVEKNGYKVNHEKQALVPKVEMKRRPKVDMKKADKVLPKPKTKLEKQKAKEEKEEKQMQKKKEERVKRKEIVSKALEQQKKQMDRKKILKNKNISNNKKDKMSRIEELYKKLGYEEMPYPAQILDSDKLKKLKQKQTTLEDSMKGKPLKEKLSIKKELDKLKKEIDKEKKELREKPKKLSKDEKELLELIQSINMN